MDHVSTDRDFPYRVCGGQDGGESACVSSRGNDGQITVREWHPLGADGSGYAVSDPLDPSLIFGGAISRYDRRTGQAADVTPEPTAKPGPLAFSAADPHVLFFGANVVWQTADRGQAWKPISPDLGTIRTIAPSPLDIRRLWTDEGLIRTTVDGGLHWKNVTPPAGTARARVTAIDAGHFEALTAYAITDARIRTGSSRRLIPRWCIRSYKNGLSSESGGLAVTAARVLNRRTWCRSGLRVD